jgi:hypothetical protein
MPERVRPRPSDRRITVALRDDPVAPPGLDPRKLEFLAKDSSQFLEGNVDLEHVLARVAACLPLPRLRITRRNRVANVAFTLADAALILGPIPKTRDIHLWQWNGDGLLALTPEQLAVADVLAQVLLDLAPNDLAEPAVILVYLLAHAASAVPPRGMRIFAPTPTASRHLAQRWKPRS